MASIIYVTDRKMIEYHRINGNEELNFWRPSSQTRIRKFHPGDLIFFLTKIRNRGARKEKGVVGYGRYVREHKLSFDRMWSEYKEKNGYSTKEDLYKALEEYARELPDKIDCLYVEDLTFFSHPIYPSEIGLNLPLNLESYAYLDDDQTDRTYLLLKKAKATGIDPWSAAVSEHRAGSHSFERDLAIHQVTAMYLKIKDLPFRPGERTANRALARRLAGEEAGLVPIGSGQLLKIANDRVVVYLPALYSGSDISQAKLLAGHLLAWHSLAEKEEVPFGFQVYVRKKMVEALTMFELPADLQIKVLP